MKFSASVSLPLLPLAAAITFAAAAYAEEITTLPEVEVNASRLDADVAGTPIYVIDREVIEKSTARNISDLLKSTPGIFVRQIYGNPGTEGTIDLRGFGATASQNTLILVDGRRLNDIDLSSSDIGGVPLANVDRIEIQPGGGSVLYGDGASGGTINIVTRQASKNGGSANIGIGSFDTRTADVSAQLAGKTGSANVFAQHVESDGYRANSEIERNNAGLNLGLNLGQHQLYALTQASHLETRFPGARKVNFTTTLDELHNDPRGTGTPRDFGKEKRQQFVLGWKAGLSDTVTLIIDASQRYKEQWSLFGDYDFGADNYSNAELTTYALTPRLLVNYGSGAVSNKLQTGIDFYDSNYVSRRGRGEGLAPIHSVGIDAETRSLYVFQTSSWRQTKVSAGLRRTTTSQDANDTLDLTAPGAAVWDTEAADASQEYSENLYEFGISQEIVKHLSLMASLSRSVRFGTVDEYYEYDTSISSQAFSPLRPQVGHNVEGSLEYNDGRSRVTATAYKQKLRDEILYNASTFTNNNIDPTLRQGATLSAGTTLGVVTLNASLTSQDATFRDGPNKGKHVPVVPKQLSTLGLGWQISPAWDFAFSTTHVGSMYLENDVSNSFGLQAPSHNRSDARLGFKLKYFRSSLSIQNIGDKESVYDYGISSAFTPGAYSTYPLAGREYRFDIGLDF